MPDRHTSQPEQQKDALRRIATARDTGAVELNLKALGLASVPDEVWELTNLTDLRLDGNQLTEIPSQLANLRALRRLDLDSNRLISLPKELGQLKALEMLFVFNNRLTALPSALGGLDALQSLILDNNKLLALPKEIWKLATLRMLSLSNTQLADLPEEVGRLEALHTLYLNKNQLIAIPKELAELKALRTLHLNDNQLTNLPRELGKLKALTQLNLANNRLATVPEAIAGLKALTTLHLNDNELTTLPEELGEMKALAYLSLANNRLTALPKQLRELKALREFLVEGNPLPAEILALAERPGALLAYLRSLAEPAVSSSSDLHLFNEVKLLLVGPGEVGKTWLLQALQGKVPSPTKSTKGIEIVREPLDITHGPSRRTVHFNCWDFGGQDLYQVTQQIFFSPTAIYLLVWKPRPGFDPQLEQRLERIRISAGPTARIFIVATHADDGVPSTISEQALRERYGDLIPSDGFHHVDSHGGPEGTGIEKLRQSIVAAAVDLSGMSIGYAREWAAAHKAIRAIEEPSIPSRFRELCVQAKMEPSYARVLAIMMDVQGHVTYFDEVGEGSGITGEDNIVVRRPEWLAKAVAFVLEDKQTREASGVLHHTRLKEIWARDEGRTCPGYPGKLHRYFLWLMWKFDIAYRQSGATSLLPELIDRGRPDDELHWTPTHSLPTGSRQAELICKVRQSPPDRMVSVLSAAAHPLRRMGEPKGRADTLDRNWRTGFFLGTAHRGECFIELDEQARELWFTARGDYPADITRQLERTLTEIIKDRWPNLKHEFAVPCRHRSGDKRCPGTFKRDFLERKRGQTVPCDQCEHDWEVDALLDGFEPGVERMIALLKELRAGQDQLLVMALRTYRDLMNPHKGLIDRAPCMFSVTPEDATGWNIFAKLTESRVGVTCWCEHPDGPHPNAFSSMDPMASYVIRAHKDWVRQVAPYVNWAAMILKAVVPLAGSVIRQGLDTALPPSLGKQLDLMADISKAIPTGKLEARPKGELDEVMASRPEIDSLRHIQDAILDESNVKKSQRWGGLRPVLAKTGETLWLCERHAAIQSPPVPESLG